MKKYIPFFLIALIVSILTLAINNKFLGKTTIIRENNQNGNFKFASINGPQDAFVQAAKISTPAVVHINTEVKVSRKNQQQMDPFWQFFGMPFDQGQMPDQLQQGAGSGVIISNDGYIVTNNHVIENADKITVNLDDNRTFTARLIGTDPSTDLAVIKIEANNLSFLSFANSDNVEVGQWVLAVGNPFNLASTVTAGIVSAKARNINILREKAGNLAIESFIQTDAAVNPGNSGGALVDLSGNLIGINSAIATPTGSYAGYSFAIPSNLAKKVVKDILDFGIVQRGFLGVNIREVDDELAKDLNLKQIKGAYITDIVKGSAAEDAGLKSGDVITKIENLEIKNTADLTEHVARYRPGDKIVVDFIRKGETLQKDVVLKSKDNKTSLLSKSDVEKSSGNILNDLGIEITELTSLQAKKLGIGGGVIINKVTDGIVKQNTNLKEGFIVFAINNKYIKSKDDFEQIIKESKGGGVLLQGRYENSNGIQYYAFGY
ncbi:MAG: Do family serine endopeptidase [Sphingobacteriales bacterium]|nr:MAG: Do family serine endopeptidase [Sphingobacteriales bacterium]